jgi:hypothetical protein
MSIFSAPKGIMSPFLRIEIDQVPLLDFKPSVGSLYLRHWREIAGPAWKCLVATRTGARALRRRCPPSNRLSSQHIVSVELRSALYPVTVDVLTAQLVLSPCHIHSRKLIHSCDRQRYRVPPRLSPYPISIPLFSPPLEHLCGFVSGQRLKHILWLRLPLHPRLTGHSIPL